jgi:hypothetical protein
VDGTREAVITLLRQVVADHAGDVATNRNRHERFPAGIFGIGVGQAGSELEIQPLFDLVAILPTEAMLAGELPRALAHEAPRERVKASFVAVRRTVRSC